MTRISIQTGSKVQRTECEKIFQGLQPSCKANAVFRQRGYWASKNPKGNTSRDKFGQSNLQPQVDELERELTEMGMVLPTLKF